MAMPLVKKIKTPDRKFIYWYLEVFLLKPKVYLNFLTLFY